MLVCIHPICRDSRQKLLSSWWDTQPKVTRWPRAVTVLCGGCTIRCKRSDSVRPSGRPELPQKSGTGDRPGPFQNVCMCKIVHTPCVGKRFLRMNQQEVTQPLCTRQCVERKSKKTPRGRRQAGGIVTELSSQFPFRHNLASCGHADVLLVRTDSWYKILKIQFCSHDKF